MRTTITVQEATMKDLVRFSRSKTKTAAVNHAIRDWVRLKKLQQIKSLCGKLDVAEDLAELRTLEMKED